MLVARHGSCFLVYEARDIGKKTAPVLDALSISSNTLCDSRCTQVAHPLSFPQPYGTCDGSVECGVWSVERDFCLCFVWSMLTDRHVGPIIVIGQQVQEGRRRDRQ